MAAPKPVPRPDARARPSGCETAGQAITPPGWYIVANGDNLWHIAEAHYKNGSRYRRIARANTKRIRAAGMIRPCQRIYLPR